MDKLKEIISELEKIRLGGSSISRVVIDVKTEKVVVDFITEKTAGDGMHLERYERDEARKIEGWKAEYEHWKERHNGPVELQDLKELAIREVGTLLQSGFLKPDSQLLNCNKLKRAELHGQEMAIGQEHNGELALLSELMPVTNQLFCFTDSRVINDYIEAYRHKLSAEQIDSFQRFKAMMGFIWDDISHMENYDSISDSRKAIIDQILQYVEQGEWVAPATASSMSKMMKEVLGVVPGILNADDRLRSDTLWKLLESGRSNRVKITFQNLIGYFSTRGWLKGGSANLNRMFFGNEEGRSNIDKGVNENEMSSGFKTVIPLLDKYGPKNVSGK